MSVNEQLRQFLFPDGKGHIPIPTSPYEKLKGKWTRFWIVLDVEAYGASQNAFFACAFTVLDLHTGKILTDKEYFGATHEVWGNDASTDSFWENFKSTRDFLSEVGIHRSSVCRQINNYFCKTLKNLIGEETWSLVTDNPSADIGWVEHLMTRDHYPKPLRCLINGVGSYGRVRDMHGLLLMFFSSHENPEAAYDAFHKMAEEVYREAEFDKIPGEQEDPKALLHHPLFDARVNALMLLSMFRFMSQYKDWLSLTEFFQIEEKKEN